MRLTIINQFYTPDISPTAHLAASLAAHRASLGDEVTVVASRGGYVAASADAASERRANLRNPRVYRIWTPRLGKGNVIKRCIDYGTFYGLALWRMLRLPGQDVIISLTTPPYIAYAAVAHRLLHPRRTRLVLWNMDCYPDAAERMRVIRAGGLLSRFLRWLNRRLFARIDHLVCLDTAMMDLLVSQYAPPARRRALPATVIPNWEPAELFPAGDVAAPWRKADELGLAGRFVVLYLGNTGYGHQFETVLDAAALLAGEPVTFLFVGGGQRWKWLADEVAARRLANVVMHGYVPKDETAAVMAAADCALITLRDDALGVMSPSKLHANLAMGLPVIYIGPPGSNVDDAIRAHDCGRAFAHGEVDAVVDFIRSLMNDEPSRHAYRRRARSAFEAAYCDARALPRFDEVIESLYGEAGAAKAGAARRRGGESEDANAIA